MTNGRYQHKYRVASARAQWWDYGADAVYFVTICTKDRICHLGDVQDGVIVLSDVGRVAQTCWLEIPEHFPFVRIDTFVVMPNHVHGILIINKNGIVTEGETESVVVETQNFASLRLNTLPKNKFGPQSQNLASIVRGFKIGVTKYARPIYSDFAWQPRYHDHIIRDEISYRNISEYIRNNPLNWTKDRFHH